MSLPIGLSTNYLLQDVAVDSAGTVYVLDSAGNQVLVENQDYLGLAAPGVLASGPPGYPGNAPSLIGCGAIGGFNNPQGIAVTGDGTLYVADTGNHRVVKYNMTTGACSVVMSATATITAYFNGTASTYTLVSPVGIAVNEYGDIFISDKFAGPGNFMNGYQYNVWYSGLNNFVGMIVWIPAKTITVGGHTYTAGTPYDLMDSNTPVSGNTYYCPALLTYCGYADGFAGVGDEPYYPGLTINYNLVVDNGVANPTHIAWDNYDDILFIADTGNSRILAIGEQWLQSGQPQTPTGNNNPIGSLPSQVGSAGAPWEIETTGAWHWPTQLPIAYDNEITWNPTPGNTEQPKGIAVDGLGNLYWTDVNYGAVYELPHPASGNWNSTNYQLNTWNQSYTGSLVNPNSIYADQWGTVYTVDTGTGPGPTTGHDRVITNIPQVNGSGSTSFGAVNFHNLPLNLNKTEWQQLAFVVASGVTASSATAFTTGTEFLDFNVSDNSSPTCTSGFVGNGSSYCYVWISFKPTAPGLRRGSVTLYSGTGANAVEIANIPVFGVGTAPEAEFYPTGYGAAISTGSVPTLEPMQIALDGNNNLFVANYGGDNVLEVPPAGGTAQQIAAPSGGTATYPEQAAGVALDGAGNVYISDHQGSVIWVAFPLSTYWGFTPLIIDGLSTPLNEPMEINFDAAGNLYIADWGNNRVVEVSGIFINGTNGFEGRGSVIMTNGSYLGQGYNFWSTTTNPNGLRSVTGVAVDPLQNVYIADSVGGNIVTAPQSMNQIAPGYLVAGRLNWPYSSNGFTGVAGVFKSPQGVTSDGMGNIYVADAGNSRIVAGNFQTEFGNRWSGFGVVVASNVATPGPLGNNLFGVAVDPWGNVIVPDYANNRIVEYYPTTPPTENFASTYVSLTSSDSPKTVKLWNIGDELLRFLAPATGLNPSISTLTPGTTASFTYGSGSSCTQINSTGSFTLAGGNGCTIIDSFVPAYVGSITGSIVATDNNLYPAGWNSTTTVNTTQTIPLTGTGQFDFTLGVPNPASAIMNPGGTAIFNFTITPVGQSTFLAPVTFTITGAPTTNGASVTFTPSNIAIGAQATNVVMTVVAPSILTTENRQPENLGRKLAPISFALLLLPLLGVRRMRKTWQRYLMLLIMLAGGFAATTAMSGCSTTPSGYFGQGTYYDYNIYVTGTGLGVSHTTTAINITVN
jgi:sugar lactone lactonase YvrE